MEKSSVPLLKPPVWTWEVPAYLFAGGIAGISAVMAFIVEVTGSEPSLARDARWVALAGGLISPLLLISDLGRPSRFFYMLRVFKRQSAMSVGAWTLVVFGPATLASVLLRQVMDAGGSAWLTLLMHASDAVAAATGLILVTYTGVLLGATAIPVWAANARLLPWLFTATALGATASLLELIGHPLEALHRLALIAAALEVIVSLRIRGLARRPGALRAGEMLAGGVPLILRLLVPVWPAARTIAGVSALAGAALSRVGWIAAGRASALESRG